jgi:hypothetical protein
MLEVIHDQRFLAGTTTPLEVTFYLDGTKVNPASAGTVTVRDEAGTIVSSGAAVVVGGNGANTSGKLRYTPTAAQMVNVNRLSLTWSDVVIGTDPAISVTTRAEAVGELMFTEAAARTFDAGAMGDATLYPDDLIRQNHNAIMDAIQAIVRYPLGRRNYREVMDGDGSPWLRLAEPYVQAVRTIETRSVQTWTPLSPTEMAGVIPSRWGMLTREDSYFPRGVQNVRVSYDAGKPIAGELRRAALIILRQWLVKSNIPARALFQTTDQGQFRVAVASPDGRWFGLPEADAIIARHVEPAVW